MTQTLKKEELHALTRFNDQWCRLQKIRSKHAGSRVVVNQYEDGDFRLFTYKATKDYEKCYGAMVCGMGLNDYLRTSPIVKIIDQDDISTTFETAGGIYRLTKRG